MTVIEVEGVTKRYRDVVALDGLSLSVSAGEVFAIVGPNGAGKTTLVEMLEGFRAPDAGRLSVLGLDPRRGRAELAARVGVMLQEGGIYPGIRVGEALRLFASYYKDPIEPAALLETVDLVALEGRTYRRLSGGEKQRLSLALALIGRPELVFLDEPTSGMDPRARSRTWETVRGLHDDGVTVVLTTHFMDEAEKLADRVAIVDHGRLAALDSPAGLLAGGGGEVRFVSRPGLDMAALTGHLGAAVREESPGHYVIESDATPALTARLADWLAVQEASLESFGPARRSLEDLFLEMTREQG